MMRSLTVLTAVITAWLAATPAPAIVIRHDRDDAHYLELGSRFPAAVSVLPDGAGTLIAPEWVLTAAHVARGVAAGDPRVEIGGREIAVTEIRLHQEWKTMAHDVALLRLGERVEGIQPALLYEDADEVGQVVTFVGRGDFGTGLTGPVTMDRKKRGATNRVEAADDDWILFTFDAGGDATELEGVSGPGDSGGPALIEREGRVYVLGVSVFADGEDGPGRYGVREGYTRVSTHRDWILGAMGDAGMAKILRPGKAPARQSSDGGREVAVTAVPGSARLPGTAAGRLVAGYFEAYNSGKEEAMLRFFAENSTAAYLESRSSDERREIYRRLRGEYGDMRLHRVLDVESTIVTAIFVTATGALLEFRFELQPGDGLRIAGVRAARIEIDRD